MICMWYAWAYMFSKVLCQSWQSQIQNSVPRMTQRAIALVRRFWETPATTYEGHLLRFSGTQTVGYSSIDMSIASLLQSYLGDYECRAPLLLRKLWENLICGPDGHHILTDVCLSWLEWKCSTFKQLLLDLTWPHLHGVSAFLRSEGDPGAPTWCKSVWKSHFCRHSHIFRYWLTNRPVLSSLAQYFLTFRPFHKPRKRLNIKKH